VAVDVVILTSVVVCYVPCLTWQVTYCTRWVGRIEGFYWTIPNLGPPEILFSVIIKPSTITVYNAINEPLDGDITDNYKLVPTANNGTYYVTGFDAPASNPAATNLKLTSSGEPGSEFCVDASYYMPPTPTPVQFNATPHYNIQTCQDPVRPLVITLNNPVPTINISVSRNTTNDTCIGIVRKSPLEYKFNVTYEYKDFPKPYAPK
jgi:hypothetical protein